MMKRIQYIVLILVAIFLIFAYGEDVGDIDGGNRLVVMQ